MINGLGLKPCKCSHRRYHCQCPKDPLDLLRPSKRDSLITGNTFTLTPSPKQSKRKERGSLKLDEHFFRASGLEDAAMNVVDHREALSVLKGQSNMFVGEQEQKRLQNVDLYSVGADNEYYGEF